MKHKDTRAEKREAKRRIKMKVSGKHVLRLHRIIITKSKNQSITESSKKIHA